ncbi:MAG: twin-arginine translocation signal domain-containing protein, partial [Deltaproteobacteria bacterium]|nr:twin-arginine translocation signal domain-containing protein [Deltaproteobacteria bacterium]
MADSEERESRKKKLNRREFLVGSGAALASGAIAAGTPVIARESAKKTYPKSEAYIVYDSRVCWGCQSCMFACSSAH